MDWRELIYKIDKPIIGVNDDGVIDFSNEFADGLFGSSLVGLNISKILTSFEGNRDKEIYATIAETPLKISKKISIDGKSFYSFTSLYANSHLLNTVMNDIDIYAFFASVEGDFLMSTKKLRKLLNIGSDAVIIKDGWDKLVDTLKDFTVSGSGVKRKFEEFDTFSTLVPSGPCEGSIIKWNIAKYSVDNAPYFLVTGFDMAASPDTPSDEYELFRNLDGMLIPAFVISKAGIIHVNSATNINQFALGSGFQSDIDSVFPDPDDKKWLSELMGEVSSNKGLMFDRTIKIKDRDFNTHDFATRGYTVLHKNEPAVLMFAVGVSKYTNKIYELEADQRILNLYNSILNYLVRSTELNQALILVAGDISVGLAASSVCLKKVEDGLFMTLWENCQFTGPDAICAIKKGMTVEACETDEIQVSAVTNDGYTDVVIPVILDDSAQYVICLKFVTLKPEIANNITDLKMIVEIGLRELKNRIELEHKSKRLEKLNQFRSDVLEAVNHDLRTPLTSIIGFSELLQMDILGDDERKESIDSIKKSADHMNRLIEELTGYTAMLSDNEDDPKKSEIDLQKFLIDVCSLMKPIFAGEQIDFRTEIQPGSSVVSANKTKLEQIFINVLGNASKFIEKDGTVVLRCEQLGDKFVRVTVSDDGPGVSKRDQEKIFTKYGRATTKENGSGLGLFLTKNYMESIGGSIWLSSPGELGGATFYLTFPVV